MPVPHLQDLSAEAVTVRVNGIALHVIVAGDPAGSPVVLLHGFPEFWYGWRHQIGALVAAGHRVIVPDQRGYHLSDKPPAVADYAIPHLTADIAGLLDHFGYERAGIAGHDWGAMVAWWLALTHPQRVARLAILNVPHPYIFRRHLKENPAQIFRSWYAGFFQIPFLPEGLISLGGYRAAAQAMISSARPGTFSPEEMAHYREAWAQPGAMTGMINWYRAYVRHAPPAPASWRVPMPTLMLWGAQDNFLSKEMAQPSIDLCDHGRLVLYEDATHWVQHDERAAVNAELIAFFSG